MREQNMAFKRQLRESRIRTARRQRLQTAFGLLLAGIALAIVVVQLTH